MSYEAREPLDAPIVVFRTAGATGPADLGWDALTTSGATAVDVPGAHISMLLPPHVATLASSLGGILSYITDPAGASTVV
jgi:thioesterase domain-containing protein